MANRKMPQNLDAEMAVLGSMFLKEDIIDTLCDELDTNMFYHNPHKKIFEAIKSLRSKNIPLDITTISDELENMNALNEVGGIEYLTEVVSSVATATNVDYYIGIIKDKAIRRFLINTANEVASETYDSTLDLNELLDNADKKMTDVIQNRRTGDFIPIGDALRKTQDILERLAKNQTDITGVPSGFPDLDKMTSGFHENELIIIAARPGVGKTAFSLNIASYAALHTKKPVAIFNMEMSVEQLLMRMISSIGRIDSNKLKTGFLNHNDWKRVNEAMSQLGDSKLFIEDVSGLTISEIKAKCRKLKNSEKDLGLVIIDYLQLIQGSARYAGNRVQEVTEISRGLKTMAMELKVPVIALAQLSRSVETRENKKPTLSDLRESGSIEQDADIVGFLYREDYYKNGAEVNAPTEFIIAKHRNGGTGKVDLLFEKNLSNFVPLKKESEGIDV